MITDLAIVVGDPHLAERIWTNRRTLVDDAMYSFRQAVLRAIQHRLPMVLLGDIFDAKSVTSGVLQFFCEQMSELQLERIPVYFVQGNHDCVTLPWPEVHEWPVHLNEESVTLINGIQAKCECYGLDYYAVSKYAAMLQQIPASAKVLFTHQGWSDFGKMGSSEVAMSSMLPRGIVVATGDLHMVVTTTGCAANGDAVPMLSPGAICMQSISDPHQHYIYKMQIDDAGSVLFEPILLHTRQVYEFSCNAQDEFDAAVLQIASLPKDRTRNKTEYDISSPIVRIRYPITVTADSYVRLTAAAARSGVHLFTDPQVDAVTSSTINAGDVYTDKMSTLSDAVQLLKEEPQEVRDLAARMINEADNVVSFLTEFQKQYMQDTVTVCE